jgi:hypothetical protein
MYNLFLIGAISSGGSPGLGAHKLTLLYNFSQEVLEFHGWKLAAA